ncbi:hypothetical protein G6F24_017835 [Rhizopus arrhizus]|nr:hypothetical protein G6F24_017835 [Rhizopus arrhizus]
MPVCTSSTISSSWFSSANLRRPCMNSLVAGITPPSPCTGSMMIAATRLGSMSHLNSRSSALSESATVMDWVPLGNGTW